MNNLVVKIEEKKQIAEMHKTQLAALRDGGLLPHGCDEKEAWARVVLGNEMGLTPVQSLNGIVMLKGKPTLHSDSIPSIVMASGLVVDMGHEFRGEGDNLECVYWVIRKGLSSKQEWSYSLAEAKAAGLAGRDVWKSHAKKMLFNRARTYCLRNVFPDVLGNLYTPEEVSEIKETPEVLDPIKAEAPKSKAKPKAKAKPETVEEKVDALNEDDNIAEAVFEEVSDISEETSMGDLAQPTETDFDLDFEE